jgi:hypothetical protein
MHLQTPILRIPTDIPRAKPISAPLVATTIEPSSELTTLDWDYNKRQAHLSMPNYM